MSVSELIRSAALGQIYVDDQVVTTAATGALTPSPEIGEGVVWKASEDAEVSGSMRSTITL
jgi:hypothetical protein